MLIFVQEDPRGTNLNRGSGIFKRLPAIGKAELSGMKKEDQINGCLGLEAHIGNQFGSLRNKPLLKIVACRLIYCCDHRSVVEGGSKGSRIRETISTSAAVHSLQRCIRQGSTTGQNPRRRRQERVLVVILLTGATTHAKAVIGIRAGQPLAAATSGTNVAHCVSH